MKKTGCSLVDFEVIFPMQSLEFTKSLKFGSILKKITAIKKSEILNFHLKIDFFMDKKYIFYLN